MPKRSFPVVIVEKQVAGVNEAALERFVRHARQAVGLKGQVNVLITGSGAIRLLNRRFLAKDKPTDVLSFPSSLFECGSRQGAKIAGEVAVSADIAVQNAIRLGHSPLQEIKVLILHGILHLAGFDHERDNGQMARKEMRLRRALGLPLSLAERAESRPARGQSSKLRRGTAAGSPGRRKMA